MITKEDLQRFNGKITKQDIKKASKKTKAKPKKHKK